MKESQVLKIVECSGTPYEIGRQYGEACRANLQKTLEMSMGRLICFAKVTKEEILAQVNKFLPQVENFDHELIEFVKGEAEGAGISFQEAFYPWCGIELLTHYGQISSMCTSFAATGEATQEGKTVLGQNIDFSGFPIDLLKIRHTDGLEQLALFLGGVAFNILNSNGYGNCANLTLANSESYQLNLPFGCYLPKAMRQKSIGEALGILCQAARGLVYHQIASAEGDIIGFESIFDDFNVLQPEKDMMVHSNHYLTERFKKGDWGYMLCPDTYLRVNRIKRLMERHYGNITPEVMMGILSDHNNHPKSICMHKNMNQPPETQIETLASCIMVPEDRKMFIALGNPCQYEYIEYKL